MQWTVSLPDRLDLFLVSTGAFPSRAKAQEAIGAGRVSVNDMVASKIAQRLQEGDTVLVEDNRERTNAIHIDPVDLQLPVLHEDAACVVINKPAGIAVHPGSGMSSGERTLLNGIAFLFAERRVPFSSQSVLVHRLDKETTGCLLIAKSPAAHAQLQEQFENRTVEKTYLAAVAGIPKQSEALIDAPIGRSIAHREKMSILGASKTRTAKTGYRILATGADTALLACNLHTGRTHQIRVHLSAIGHPILGDDTYVSPLSERIGQQASITTLLLHAWHLKFTSPDGMKPVAVTALPAENFLRSIGLVGIRWTP